jgi:hypothetical protein
LQAIYLYIQRYIYRDIWLTLAGDFDRMAKLIEAQVSKFGAAAVLCRSAGVLCVRRRVLCVL